MKITRLLCKFDKVTPRPVCARARLEQSADGKQKEDEFEDGPPWVVLVGRLDITGDDGRARDLVKCILGGCECVGDKDKRRLRRRLHGRCSLEAGRRRRRLRARQNSLQNRITQSRTAKELR